MTCAEFQQQISLSLYGELAPAEEALLAAHLTQCAACREMDARLAETVALLRRRSAPLPAVRRRLRWGLAAAAAAVVLACAGVAVEVARTPGAGPEPRAATRPSVAPPTPRRTPAPVPVPAPAPAPAPAAATGPTELECVQRALASGATEAPPVAGRLGYQAEDFLGGVALGDDPLRALCATEWLGARGTRRSSRALRSALGRPVTRLAAFRGLLARGELDLAADVVPALADPVLRREAAGFLAGCRSEAALAALFGVAVRGDETCRAACRTFPAGVALPFLSAAARQAETREAAVGLLLTTDGDVWRAALVELARDDVVVGTAALARAVQEPGDARAGRFLVLALSDDVLGPEARAAVARLPIRRLRAAFEAGLREPERRAALVALLVPRAAEPAARDLLVSVLDDDEARPIAARALLEQKDLRPIPLLLRSGTDADLAALAVLASDLRRRELVRALHVPGLRAGAVRAISNADGALWRDLAPLLQVKDLRVEVAQALARAGAAGAVPFLIPYLSVAPGAGPIHGALVALAGIDLGPEPYRWERWWRAGAPR